MTEDKETDYIVRECHMQERINTLIAMLEDAISCYSKISTYHLNEADEYSLDCKVDLIKLRLQAIKDMESYDKRRD